MKILAIETSCDDTSVAICNKNLILSLKTYSQIKEHNKFGGVVPEIASRLHSENIYNIINLALEDANEKIENMEAVVFTKGPGLINTLQVGLIVAKTLSLMLNIPFYGVDHIEGHIYSPFIGLSKNVIPENALVLIVSGGHTLLGIKNKLNLEIIGQTKDDAIGEAYDKVAKILDLGYPGGPKIDDIYFSNKEKIDLKAPTINLVDNNFSYSGLKSWVLNNLENNSKKDLAIAFQESAINQIIIKLIKVIDKNKIKNLIVGGGVSANLLLKEKLEELAKEKLINVYLPKKIYSSDNAAMIGYSFYVKEINLKSEKFDSDVYSNFSLDKINS